MEALSNLIALLNDNFLGYVLIAALVICGVYFTFVGKFLQFTEVKEMWRLLFAPADKTHDVEHHISSFHAFSISTAARVGTGNIAGVAIAITVGGPGAVFWMWAIAIIGAASAFIESALAQVYKVKDGSKFRGGPAYYMKTALKKPWMGTSFAVIITLTFAFVFNSVQSNTIANSFSSGFSVNTYISGFFVALLTAIIIFGGLKRVAAFSSVIVPVFAVIYIVVTFIVVILNIEKLPSVFYTIISDAFSMKNLAGGAIGATIMTGARRGLFSNEAGMGSAPNASATASVSHPAKQGYVQAFAVFFDTLVICSCTAFIVLFSDYQSLHLTGIALTQASLSQTLGIFAKYFVSLSLFLFAFSSVIGNYYYGQANVEFITTSKTNMFIFRSLVVLSVFAGALLELQLVWNMADLFMTIMALMNITAILLLRKQALIVLDDYRKQKKAGIVEPVFNPDNVEGIENADAWKK